MIAAPYNTSHSYFASIYRARRELSVVNYQTGKTVTSKRTPVSLPKVRLVVTLMLYFWL
jgi:hypothetical protein